MRKYEKMDPKVKKVWLDALRSGAYRQTKELLRRVIEAVEPKEEDQVAYCCLGILCNLGRGSWVETEEYESAGQTYVPYRSDVYRIRPMDDPTCPCLDEIEKLESLTAYPPALVLEKAGLAVAAAKKLGSMNDRGDSFKKIADWIEKHL